MVRQIGTLAFVVTLVVVGLPVTAQAEGERPTASPQRVLTWHGQPLSTVLGDAGHARTSPKWSGGAHDPVVLFVAQDRAGEQQAEETQGMSRRKKVLIGTGIGVAAGAAFGAYAGASYCANETGVNCDSGQAQAGFTGVFALIGVGVGAGIGALFP